MKMLCVVCGRKVEVKSSQTCENSRGSKMAKGKCPKCGTKVSRILTGPKSGRRSSKRKSR